MSKGVRVLVGVAGLVVVVLGIVQISRGLEEINSSGIPTATEAQAAAEAAAGNLTKFTSASRGISFQYPKDWTTEEPAEGAVFFKAKTGLVSIRVMSEDLPQGTKLQDYVKANVDGIEAMLSKQGLTPHILGQGDIQVDGQPAARLLYTYVVPEQKLEVEVTQVFVIHGKRAYGTCLMAPKSVHDEFAGLMAKILASVQLK